MGVSGRLKTGAPRSPARLSGRLGPQAPGWNFGQRMRGPPFAALGVLRNRARRDTEPLGSGLIRSGVAGLGTANCGISISAVVDAPVLAGIAVGAFHCRAVARWPRRRFTFTTPIVDLEIAGPPADLARRPLPSGQSMGIQLLKGQVAPAQGTLDIQGVVSPLYLLNGIGAGFLRRGAVRLCFWLQLPSVGGDAASLKHGQSAVDPDAGVLREIFPPHAAPA